MLSTKFARNQYACASEKRSTRRDARIGVCAGLGVVACLVLGACVYAQSDAADEAIEAEIEAKQGAEVDRLCFVQSINGWKALGKDFLLLKKAVNDWYKLDLLGTCHPEWAFDAIAILPQPSTSVCLRPGDQIRTFDSPASGSCMISKIHTWDEDAEVAR